MIRHAMPSQISPNPAAAGDASLTSVRCCRESITELWGVRDRRGTAASQRGLAFIRRWEEPLEPTAEPYMYEERKKGKQQWDRDPSAVKPATVAAKEEKQKKWIAAIYHREEDSHLTWTTRCILHTGRFQGRVSVWLASTGRGERPALQRNASVTTKHSKSMPFTHTHSRRKSACIPVWNLYFNVTSLLLQFSFVQSCLFLSFIRTDISNKGPFPTKQKWEKTDWPHFPQVFRWSQNYTQDLHASESHTQ